MANLAMSATNGEEPPLKKKKKPWKKKRPSISSLPDDLIVSCLARVSRLYYPILSLVSKSFRSLIASSRELYQTRTLLNRTESCLYVCLQFPPDFNPRWFTLCKKPNKTLTKNKKKEKSKSKSKSKSSGYVLAPIRILNSVEWPNLICFGCKLYALSEKFDKAAPCSNILVFDCGKAISTRIAYTDSKMNLHSLWMDLHYYIREDWACSTCRIKNITYSYDSSVGFEWCYDNSDVKRQLKGLEGLPKFACYSNVQLADYGGKMMVLWDKYVYAKGGYKEKMIWCAEISLENRNNGEAIWGEVDWFDEVFRVPKSYKFAYVTAATV